MGVEYRCTLLVALVSVSFLKPWAHMTLDMEYAPLVIPFSKFLIPYCKYSANSTFQTHVHPNSQ
jgi:hypothetical protein